MPDVGLVVPVAERGARTEAPDELASLLTGELTALLADELRYEMERRLADVEALKRHAFGSEAETRRYTQATQALRTWAHGIHLAIHTPAAVRGLDPQHER